MNALEAIKTLRDALEGIIERGYDTPSRRIAGAALSATVFIDPLAPSAVTDGRATFEAWKPVRGNVRNTESGYGDYVDSLRQAQWEGWQAARANLERVGLTNAEISVIAINRYGTKATEQEFAFARDILSAQAGIGNPDGRSIITRNRIPLSDEDKAAFHKAAENRDHAVELPSGALMFINYGEEPQDYSDLDCPHCGGSGHKGDIRDTQQTQGEAAIAAVKQDDVTDKEKILAGIQRVCVSANQQFNRCGRLLTDWDAGFVAGQLHIFESYLDADKGALREAANYIAKLSQSTRDDPPPN